MKRNNPNFIENYFTQIDSKEKAYWLGWLLTDGGVSKKNDIEIAILKEDEYILHQFEKDLGINNHVKSFGEKYVRFSISSVNMCKDLIQYGIVPNKTLNLKYPSNIPKQYECHLIRGMFDGDGGITVGEATRYYKHREKYYTKPYQELSFTGTYDMCEGLQNVININTGVPIKNITKNHNIFRVRWSNQDEIMKIFEFIYRDCDNHFLTRKKNKFQEVEMRIRHN